MKRYAYFRGRARRREFWYFNLFNFLAAIAIGLMATIIAAGAGGNAASAGEAGVDFYSLGTMLPALAVNVRRLHDTGRSAWYLLLVLIPFVGFALVVFFCQDSQPGSNKYGPNPKAYTDRGNLEFVT